MVLRRTAEVLLAGGLLVVLLLAGLVGCGRHESPVTRTPAAEPHSRGNRAAAGQAATTPQPAEHAVEIRGESVQPREGATSDTETLPRLLAERGFTAPEGFKARIIRLGSSQQTFDWHESASDRENWWPASTVKLFAAVAVLETLRELDMPLRSRAVFHYDEPDQEAASLRVDQLIELAIGHSDNVAFDRLVELVGYDRIHQDFFTAENGAPSSVLLRCYGQRQRDEASGVCSARVAPRITLTGNGRREEIPARRRTGQYDCPDEGNCTTLEELAEVMRRVMTHERLSEAERYQIRDDDLAVLREALSHAKNYRLAEIFEESCPGFQGVWHKPGFAMRWVSDVLFLRHRSGQEWVVAMAGRRSRRALDDAAHHIGSLLCEDALRAEDGSGAGPRDSTPTSGNSSTKEEQGKNPGAPPDPVVGEGEDVDPMEHRTVWVPDSATLAPFFRALARVEEERGVARVSHFGDSSIGRDELPHFLRTRFQGEFGNAGPGFVLLQPHSPSYRNQSIRFAQPVPWEFCFITFRCKQDGHYGLGGVVAESRGGATTVFDVPEDMRSEEARFELWYAAQPRGGHIELLLGRSDRIVLPTAEARLTDRWHTLTVPPGTDRIRVRALGRGLVRGYGAVLERGTAGVVWDTHSMIGAFTHRLLAQDQGHLQRQLQHRETDLITLSYGGNDLRRLVGGIVTREQLQTETERVIAHFRAARPEAACLFLGTIEHLRSGQAVVRSEDVVQVVDAQRHAAEAAGCAFFDTFRAMGGPGSYELWRRQGLAAEDGKHLTRRGRERVAEWLFRDLLRRYRERGPASDQS